MSIALFSSEDVSEYIDRLYSQMKSEIDSYSYEKINSCTLDKLADYYADKYIIEPITVYKDSITKTVYEQKVQINDRWSRRDLVDGYHIDFYVPFDGNPILWNLRPASYIKHESTVEYTLENFEEPTEENSGVITFRFVYTASFLKSKGADVSAFIDNQFYSVFSYYMKKISLVNLTVNSFNANIKGHSKLLLAARQREAAEYSAISRTLQIPTKLSTDTPNVRYINLKRVERKSLNKPKNISQEPEYYISDNDYEKILNIIHNQCSVMESAPKGFSSLEEEKLRDIIISTLETHYENSVTGETFRKNGKTDIQVRFENKAAFIAECKVWHGIKKFEDAIYQLLGYTTWKDTKVALVVFNKSNKNFKSILSSIDKWTKGNCKKSIRKNGNMWNCTYFLADTQSDIKLAIAIYDIS